MSDPARLLAMGYARSAAKLRLPKNLAKPSWFGMSDQEVMRCLVDEMEELSVEIVRAIKVLDLRPTVEMRASVWDMVANEAADAYHFALMGTDPYRIAAIPRIVAPIGI